MTLNNRNKKMSHERHQIIIDSRAWYALQAAKLNAMKSGNPRKIGEIASYVIYKHLGAVNG